MVLKLYDLAHTQIGLLKNCKDLKEEISLEMGEKVLSFLWHQNNKLKVPQEYYIRTEEDEYVVKENSKTSGGYRSIVAYLNLEEIEGRTWKEYSVKACTAQEAADMALTETGWTCASTVPESRLRNIRMVKTDSYKIIEKIKDTFTCEIEWNTLTKTLYLKERMGEDKGVYFIKGLNLIELTDSGDTYDYVTCIVPIGADGLGIAEVNGGKEYLENYQYSNKKKTLYWEDSNYTDAQWLKEDAEYKLSELSKPRKTIQVKVLDLAKMKPEYNILSYGIGDTITVVENATEIREKQRIVKIIRYPNEPKKNTCDISNSIMSFEDMQKKLFAAAECVDNIATDNGTIRGSTVDKIDVTQIKGLERYMAEEVNEFRANLIYAKTELGAPKAIIGSVISTTTDTTILNVTDIAKIKKAEIEELYAEIQAGDYAKFRVVESENISALEARLDKIVSTEITVEYLEAHYAQLDFANVNVANIKLGFLENLMVSQGIIADRVVGSEIVATEVLTGVRIYADDIVAGTLSVERLILRGNEKSLVYALNNSGELVSKEVDTLDANILTEKTITADKIVAGTITSTEINVKDLITTGFIGANKLTADNIEVNSLFAMEIIASGSIQSSNYIANQSGIKIQMATGEWDSKYFKVDNLGRITTTGGKIGGFVIGETYMANGTTMLGGDVNSVYIGLKGISCGKNFTVTSTGKMLASDIEATGIFKTNTQAYNFNGKYINYMTILSGYGIKIETDNLSSVNKVVELSPYSLRVIQLNSATEVSANGVDFFNGNGIQKGAIGCGDTYLGIFSYGSGGIILDSKAEIRGTLKTTGTMYAKDIVPQTSGNEKCGSSSNYWYYVCTKNLRIKTGGYTEYGAINCIWKDGEIHDVISIPEDGLHASFGWAGASGYSTTTVLRGGSVRLKNSSGTVVTSDVRLKNSFRTPADYAGFFKDIEPCFFKLNDGTSDRYHGGFKAQQIEEALKKNGLTTKDFAGLVKYVVDPESEEYRGYDEEYGIIYTEFVALNTYMLQHAIQDVSVLRSAVEELKNIVTMQQEKLSLLEKEIQLLKAA